MKALNLTNQKFGKLTALYRAEKRNDKYTRWVCQCECGNICEIRTDYLRNGHTTSCGCKKEKNFGKLNLNGKRFGKLVVIEDIPPESKKCKCDCGNITIVKTYNLTNGNTQSCGCLKSKGELKINRILCDNNIKFKTQFSFEDCRFPDTNRLAYFDYAIFENNTLKYLIEYDGAQHDYGWNYEKDSLNKIKAKDSYKDYYCYLHNIPLIRISWKDYDNLTFDFLQNKIEGIVKASAEAPDMEEVEELMEEQE